MLVFSPILAAMCLHMGLAYSYFYLLFTTFTKIFEETYHFSTKTVGLSYLGVGIGFLVGQAIFAKLGDAILVRLSGKKGGEMKPEYRLPLGCVGGIFIPVGFFWYGWSAQAKVFWMVPIIGTAITGLGNSLVFVGGLPYNKMMSLILFRLPSNPIPSTLSPYTRHLVWQQTPVPAQLWPPCYPLRPPKCIVLSGLVGVIQYWHFLPSLWYLSRFCCLSMVKE
jgi:hypothetical protein